MQTNNKIAMRQRTKDFARTVIRFFVGLERSREEIAIISSQMIRSGTSVGANYREASRSRSDAEFISKIELCAQEADETQYWLELLEESCNIPASQTQAIWQEADELISIFVTMAKNTKIKRASTQ